MPTYGSAFNNSFPPAILPIAVFVLALALMIYCLNDLYRPERRVAGDNKDLWAVIIVLGSVIGCLVYLFSGRQE